MIIHGIDNDIIFYTLNDQMSRIVIY